MRRLFSAVVFGASLAASSLAMGAAAPAYAQQASANDPLSVRMTQLNAVLERVNTASAILADPRFQSLGDASNPEAMADQIDALTPDILVVRRDLQAAADEIAALPPLADGEWSQMMNAIAEDAVSSAHAVSALLEQVVGLSKALRRGDEEAVAQGALALVHGGIAIVANQALTLEARALMVGSGSSERDSVLILAQMYHGMAETMNAAVGLEDPVDIADSLRVRARKVEGLIESGRATLAAEVAAIPLYAPIQRPGLRKLYAQQEQMFALGEEVRAYLVAAAEVADSRTGEEAMGEALWAATAPVTELELRQQTIATSMMATAAELNAIAGQ